MIVLKVLGLIAVFCVPCVYGMSKSLSVKKRSAKLKALVLSFTTLSEYVRIEKSEKQKLLKKCFNAPLLNQDLSFNEEYLLKEDIRLLREFLNGFGVNDRKNEYERICVYTKLFEKLSQSAENDTEKLCKLYSSLGILTGLSLCIFLI